MRRVQTKPERCDCGNDQFHDMDETLLGERQWRCTECPRVYLETKLEDPERDQRPVQ